MRKAETIRQKRPLQTRKDIRESVEHKEGLPGERVSGRTGEEPEGSPLPVPSFSGLLDKDLTAKSCFIDTQSFPEEELTSFILEMHECLQNVPNYHDEKVWHKLPSLIELADHLVQQIRKHTPTGYSWVVQKNEEELVLQYVKGVRDLDNYNAVPLEWLPALKAQHEDLHNIVVGTLYYISLKCGLEIVYTKYDEYYIDDYCAHETDDEEENLLRYSDVAKYKKGGIACIYLKEMRDFYSLYGMQDLIDLIQNFTPRGELQKKIKAWIMVAIPVLHNPPNLNDYIIPNDEQNKLDGDPLTINDALNFPWSFYDHVFTNSEDWRNDVYSNSGMFDSGVFGEFNKSKHIEPAPIDPIKNLLLFMKMGRDVYFKFYDSNIKRFYDKRRND